MERKIRLNRSSCSYCIRYLRGASVVFSRVWRRFLSSSFLLSVLTWFVVVLFIQENVECGKLKWCHNHLCYHAVMIQKRGGTRNLMLVDGCGQCGCICLYTQPTPLPIMSVWQYCGKLEESEKTILFKKMNKWNKFITFLMCIRNYFLCFTPMHLSL